MTDGQAVDETGRRDVLVAVVAVLALGIVGFFAWDLLANRQDPPPPDPVEAAQRFADAWVEGDQEAMEAILVRRGGEELFEALQAFDPLFASDFRVTVGELTPGESENEAQVTLLPELDIPAVGTWAWTSTLQLERSRASWRIRWDHTSFHPSLAEGLTFETREGPASRAPILDRNGEPVTATGEVVTIGIEPGRVPDPIRLGETLTTLVPEAVEPLEKTFARSDLVPTWFYPLVTVPAERLAGIRDRVETLPGMILRSADGRVGTSDGFGRHLLGRVTDASEDQAAERGVEPGTPIGVGGLEEQFDEQLRGSAVTEIIAVEPDGDVRASVASFSEDAAESIRTTLDLDVQEAIENALLGRRERIAVVAVSTDGGVLGSASRPLTGYNRAFAGNYPPGAAVWGMTLYASIADTGTDADTRVPCPAEIIVGGVRIDNLAGVDLGEVSVADAIGNGCRTSVARLAGGLDRATLEELADRSFGFSEVPDVVLESAAPVWPGARDIAEAAASGVGQAQVLAPVTHLAAVAATLSDGTYDIPRVLLREEVVPSGPPLNPTALAETRAILEASGRQAGLIGGAGLVTGEGSSAEGDLGWASVVTDEFGLVVLVEQASRGEAVTIAAQILRELEALRNA